MSGSELGLPNWWHHHGIKLTKISLTRNRLRRSLEITSGAATVIITLASNLIPGKTGRVARGWIIDWKIDHFVPYGEGVKGRVHFNDEMLSSAFMLSDEKFLAGEWLIKRYDADTACQSGFIRRGKFLNIPCPGTGGDGDPNISIFVSDDVRKAVADLMQPLTDAEKIEPIEPFNFYHLFRQK